jgi:hypothetical protein
MRQASSLITRCRAFRSPLSRGAVAGEQPAQEVSARFRSNRRAACLRGRHHVARRERRPLLRRSPAHAHRRRFVPSAMDRPSRSRHRMSCHSLDRRRPPRPSCRLSGCGPQSRAVTAPRFRYGNGDVTVWLLAGRKQDARRSLNFLPNPLTPVPGFLPLLFANYESGGCFKGSDGRQTTTSAIAANKHKAAPPAAHDTQHTPAITSPNVKPNICKTRI